MATSEVKAQILEKIDQILKFDLSKLYSKNPSIQNWNNLTPEDVQHLVQIVVNLLQDIKTNISVLDSASPLDIRNIDNQLSGFINSYNNHGLPTLGYDQITTQHHNAVSQLHSLNSSIKNTGIYVDLNAAKIAESILVQKINRFTEAESVANSLATKSTDIQEAIGGAEKWLHIRRDINGKTIEEQAEAFHDMAREHKTIRAWIGKNNAPESIKEKMKKFPSEYDLGGSWLWLLASFIFAFMTGWVTYEFIIKAATKTQEIKVGMAILRITSLIVPAYLTLFAANQFLFHKRLYNNYMFKYSSMNTMNNLITTHKERGEKILDKGLDILFSEPRTKEVSGKYDSQLVTELIKMLREQIGR